MFKKSLLAFGIPLAVVAMAVSVPAKLLAVFVVDTNDTLLTTPDDAYIRYRCALFDHPDRMCGK